jgi:hypothetical protein
MFKNFSEQLKTGLAEAKQKQTQFDQQPGLPASRSHYRKMGVFVFALGCVAAVINVISYFVVERALIIMVAAMLGFWGIGMWMMVTGKTVKKP